MANEIDDAYTVYRQELCRHAEAKKVWRAAKGRILKAEEEYLSVCKEYRATLNRNE